MNKALICLSFAVIKHSQCKAVIERVKTEMKWMDSIFKRIWDDNAPLGRTLQYISFGFLLSFHLTASLSWLLMSKPPKTSSYNTSIIFTPLFKLLINTALWKFHHDKKQTLISIYNVWSYYQKLLQPRKPSHNNIYQHFVATKAGVPVRWQDRQRCSVSPWADKRQSLCLQTFAPSWSFQSNQYLIKAEWRT